MQDFTKLFKVENNPKQLEFNLPKQPKTGFITARINKDNFWNLMFWILPTGIIFFAQTLVDLITGGDFFLLASVILSPYLISRFNSVEYKNDEFRSSATNRKLGTYAPKYLGFILWLAIPFTAFWILLLHSKMRKLDENFAVYNLIFWFIPVMYCILQNLPISIVFNKTTWTKGDGTQSYDTDFNYLSDGSRHAMRPSIGQHSSSSNGTKRATNYPIGSYSSSSSRSVASYSRESIITSPIHRSYSSNIHHRR